MEVPLPTKLLCIIPYANTCPFPDGIFLDEPIAHNSVSSHLNKHHVFHAWNNRIGGKLSPSLQEMPTLKSSVLVPWQSSWNYSRLAW
jgi:hypothetical protein